jgi:Tol biopolymer transport system component
VTQVLDHKSAEGQDQFASWSPDGKRLAFYRVRSESGQDQVEGIGQTAVFVVNIDGSGLRRLTPWNMHAGDPDWSPKGDLIAFSTRPLLNFTSGRSELYTIRPDGSGMRALTSHGADGPRATQPQWTPDGEAILYTRANQSLTTRHVWAIDRTGGKDAPVLTESPHIPNRSCSLGSRLFTGVRGRVILRSLYPPFCITLPRLDRRRRLWPGPMPTPTPKCCDVE